MLVALLRARCGRLAGGPGSAPGGATVVLLSAPMPRASAAPWGLLVAAALAAPGAALAAPLRVAIPDGARIPRVLSERLRADPDLRLVAGRRADVTVARGALPDGDGPVLLLLTERGGGAPWPGASEPGPLGTPSVIALAIGNSDLGHVAWKAAPQAAVRGLPPSRGLLSVVRAGRAPLILVGTVGGRRVVVWTAPLEARANRDLAAWPLLGHALHAALRSAAGQPVPELRRWRGAPLPGAGTAMLSLVVLGLLWPLTLWAFRRARRRALPAPDVLAHYARPAAARAWSEPGFARPLGGFFVFLGASVVLLGPYFWILTVLLPNRVQPFPQVDGIWGAIVGFFELLFFLFDFATGTAFARFFAANRLADPGRALKFAQLFVWWQILSGLLQVSGVALLVLAGPLPKSTYALYGFLVLLHGVVQYPGAFGAPVHLLQGTQRFDYSSIADVLEKRVFAVLLPIPFVLLGRSWGAAHPLYGEAFGAVVGLGVGAYVTQWCTLGTGLWLCGRAGLPVRPLLGAAFARAEIREMFGFGAKAIIGQVAFRAANAIEVLVLTTLLANYTEWLGIWSLLGNRFGFLVLLAYAFFDSGVPVFGEALGAGKRALGQYLVARYLQYANLWGAVVLAVLAALGLALVLGALDPQWHRAADLVVVAAFARALACPGWVSDALQRGANHPLLFSGVLTGEQVFRLILFALLVPSLQVTGLYVAILVSLSAKTIVAWWLNHRRIIPLRLSIWQSVGAPLATGGLVWLALRGATILLAPEGSMQTQALFYGGAAAAILLSFFVLGLVGGLDADGLDEIDRAGRMTSLFAPITRALSAAARAGARLSPLHGRFPQPAAAEGLAEARSLGASGPQPDPAAA